MVRRCALNHLRHPRHELYTASPSQTYQNTSAQAQVMGKLGGSFGLKLNPGPVVRSALARNFSRQRDDNRSSSHRPVLHLVSRGSCEIPQGSTNIKFARMSPLILSAVRSRIVISSPTSRWPVMISQCSSRRARFGPPLAGIPPRLAQEPAPAQLRKATSRSKNRLQGSAGCRRV